MCINTDNLNVSPTSATAKMLEITPRAGDSAKKRRISDVEAFSIERGQCDSPPADSPYSHSDDDDLFTDFTDALVLNDDEPISPVRRRSSGSVTVIEPHDICAAIRMEDEDITAMAQGKRREARPAKRTQAQRHTAAPTISTPRSAESLLAVDEEGVGPEDSPQRYVLKRIVGEGAAGTVWSALDRETSTHVAVKIMRKNSDMPESLETEAMAACESRHVIALLDSFELSGESYMVLPLASEDLLQHIMETGPLAEDKVRPLARDLIHALEALHSAGYCHRDVKLENILLSPQGHLILADLGAAASARTQEGVLCRHSHAVGSSSYMAPEVVASNMFGSDYEGTAADVWSSGISLYAMAAGEFPFEMASPDCGRYQQFMRGEHTWPSHFSQGLIELLQQMLTGANHRASIAELGAHPYLCTENNH